MSQNRNVVVIGASAGGVSALQRLVSDLPSDLPAAVFAVLHTAPSTPSLLADILRKRSLLPVREAKDGETIRSGSIVVARPDYHLVLDGVRVRLTRGPKENRHRPAVDVLFRSAAHSHAQRVIGVVLTGALDDGTAGLWWIRDRGGLAVVQEPGDAAFPSMPSSALQYAGADHTAPLAELGGLLARLVRETPLEQAKPVPKELEIEVEIAKDSAALQSGVMELGDLTPYTCPECHGTLVELKKGGVPRFRCHTGHAYSFNNLLEDVTGHVEDALWNAIRSIEESAMLLRHAAAHFKDARHEPARASLFDKKAADTLRHAHLLRQVAMEHQTLSEDNLTEVNQGAR